MAEAAVSDLFLRLSEEPRLLLPRWTEMIWDETVRTWVEKFRWKPEIAKSRRDAAIDCFPEAMVTDFEALIPECPNDLKDRHVLAAARRSDAETIVTFNLKHFPKDALKPWGIEASHPGDYLRILYDHEPGVVTNVLHQMADRARRSLPEMLGRLAWSVSTFSNRVGEDLGIELPSIDRLEWRRTTR